MRKHNLRLCQCAVVLVAIVCMVLSQRASIAAEKIVPADANANDDVRKILAWIHALPDRQTNRILSGQYGWDSAEKIFQRTGKWPALFEWLFWQKNSATDGKWLDTEKCRQQMKEYWEQGGLVSVHMPMPNPKNKSHQLDRDMSDEEFRMVSEAGSPINKNYRQWLDRLASHLDWLQKQGVSVFIRPLHEMNGDWFWYGRRDPEDYKRLFRYTVNYLTERKGLHNLMIVYSTTRIRSNQPRDLIDYYPGDRFVDVVGVDVHYDKPPVAMLEEEYATLKQLGKPFAITELGFQRHGQKTPKNSRDSKAEIIDAIGDVTPDAVWWSSWSRTSSPAQQKNCEELYLDPRVMTRDEVDWCPNSN